MSSNYYAYNVKFSDSKKSVVIRATSPSMACAQAILHKDNMVKGMSTAYKMNPTNDPKRAKVAVELIGSRKSVSYFEIEMVKSTKTPTPAVPDVVVKDKGKFEILVNNNSDYPGVDVEFQFAKNREGTQPRIVFEYPAGGKLRLLIWADKNSEDYSECITFD